jgi:hypothetical protein
VVDATGGIFCLGAFMNWSFLCSDVPETWLSGVGEDGKAVLMAVSDMVGFIFVVMTVKACPPQSHLGLAVQKRLLQIRTVSRSSNAGPRE